MSTNQAFIKAYRHDAPLTAAPAPTKPAPPARARESAPVASAAPVAAWQSTVEIAAAIYSAPMTSIVAGPPAAASLAPLPPPRSSAPAPAIPRPAPPASTSVIGKRPLSSFSPLPVDDPPLLLPQATFIPETTISAFRWPQVCHSLWERYAEQYKHIADLIVSRAAIQPARGGIIGVASLHAGDGATTTTLCLGAALRERKRSVILVDGNFRAPRLAGLLGVKPNASWQDVLEQGLSVSEAVIRAENDGLDLLPLDVRQPNAREPNGAQLAAGLQIVITAGVLRYAYEIVLVDLGAILAPRSFATISQLLRNMRIEAAVAVTDPKHARPDDFNVAGELLDETGCQLLGLIENRTNSAR
jgi:Mrp family chromosome partitioning ATPase